MNLDLDKISNNSAVALDLVPWLKPLEPWLRFARQHAPWHLWLDKWSYPWAIRCDRAMEHWQEQLRRTEDRQRKRELREKADSIPSGKTVVLAVAKKLADAGRLAEACRRTLTWLERLQRQHGDRFGFVELVAESRLLLHLGRANVLENVGLYCERTTGLPIIPGTALKGVVSTWACWSEHFNPADRAFREFSKNSTQRRNFTAQEAQLARRILGDDNPNGSESAGEVIFLGGFPLTVPALGLDIVNPHHDAQGNPVDPKPNTFLCLEPGTQWRFAFYVRPGAQQAGDLIATTKRWMEEALTQLGIGAKTAAGYGRFRTPTDADRQAAQQAAAAAQAADDAARQRAQQEAERARHQSAVQASLQSDFPNEATFRNRVLAKLNPSQLEQLKVEVELLKRSENAPWLQKLKDTLAAKDYKDIRKRLRDKDWFPKDWLPPQ
jgi:CRISPR type III-B/RAMP module RAMP protein Cmr6